MNCGDLRPAGSTTPHVLDVPWPGGVAVPRAVGDELVRQFLRMGYGRQVGVLAVAMMAAAEEGILSQLDRGLAALDDLAARRPELGPALERQRAALIDNALATADLTRERLVQVALHLPAEMADPAFWDQAPSRWQRFKRQVAAELRAIEEDRPRNGPWEEFAIGLTAGGWGPRRGEGG
jgi:hypothetical protein